MKFVFHQNIFVNIGEWALNLFCTKSAGYVVWDLDYI